MVDLTPKQEVLLKWLVRQFEAGLLGEAFSVVGSQGGVGSEGKYSIFDPMRDNQFTEDLPPLDPASFDGLVYERLLLSQRSYIGSRNYSFTGRGLAVGKRLLAGEPPATQTTTTNMGSVGSALSGTFNADVTVNQTIHHAQPPADHTQQHSQELDALSIDYMGASLKATPKTSVVTIDESQIDWTFRLQLYVSPNNRPHVVIPYHRCSATLTIKPAFKDLPMRVEFPRSQLDTSSNSPYVPLQLSPAQVVISDACSLEMVARTSTPVNGPALEGSETIFMALAHPDPAEVQVTLRIVGIEKPISIELLLTPLQNLLSVDALMERGANWIWEWRWINPQIGS